LALLGLREADAADLRRSSPTLAQSPDASLIVAILAATAPGDDRSGPPAQCRMSSCIAICRETPGAEGVVP
jgi:hypothetical protein